LSRKYIDDHSVMLSNAAWLLVGNVAYAVFLWGVLVSIAKLGTPEMVGVYSYGFALTTPIFMLFGLRLRFVQISDSKNEAGFDDYLSIRLFTTIVAVLIAIMMGLWLRLSIEVFYVVAIIAIAKGFEAISDIYYGFFYKCERMKHIAVSQLIKGSVSLVVFGSLLYKFGSLLVACTGMAIIWGVVCIFFDCKTVSQSSGIDSRNYKILDLPIFLNFETFKNKLTVFRVIIFKAFPLGIMGFLASLSINVPRYVVESELGIRELGYYAAITYIMLGGGDDYERGIAICNTKIIYVCSC